MNKLLILLLLIPMISTSVFGKWVIVDSVKNDGFFWYEDSTIIKDKNTVKVWIKLNKLSKDEYGARSYRSLIQIDCKTSQFSYLDLSGFTEYNLEGKQVNLGKRPIDFYRWDYIPPDSIANRIKKDLCKRPNFSVPSL